MASPGIVRVTIVGLVLAAVSAIALTAQQRSGAAPRGLGTADYVRAERFMSWNTTPLVFRNGVSPTWIAGDRFWYRVTTAAGSEAILVDPASKTALVIDPGGDFAAIRGRLHRARAALGRALAGTEESEAGTTDEPPREPTGSPASSNPPNP